jgi:hypothetical protein
VAAFFKETRDFVQKTEDVTISILKQHKKPITLKEIWMKADPLLGSFGTNWVELAISIKAHLDRMVRTKQVKQGEVDGLPSWCVA